MFQTKVVEKINTFSFSTYLPEYRDVYVTLEKCRTAKQATD